MIIIVIIIVIIIFITIMIVIIIIIIIIIIMVEHMLMMQYVIGPVPSSVPIELFLVPANAWQLIAIADVFLWWCVIKHSFIQSQCNQCILTVHHILVECNHQAQKWKDIIWKKRYGGII